MPVGNLRVSLLSRLFVPKSRSLLGHGESALTIEVHATEVELRFGVSLLSRLFVQKSRFLLGHGESALTMDVHESKAVLRFAIPLLSRLFVPKSGFLLGHGESALPIEVHDTEVELVAALPRRRLAVPRAVVRALALRAALRGGDFATVKALGFKSCFDDIRGPFESLFCRAFDP